MSRQKCYEKTVYNDKCATYYNNEGNAYYEKSIAYNIKGTADNVKCTAYIMKDVDTGQFWRSIVNVAVIYCARGVSTKDIFNP